MYAYHYQSADGVLIFRYDNTTHHRSVLTFPYHKHLKDGGVTSAKQPSLEDVLAEIEGLISRDQE